MTKETPAIASIELIDSVEITAKYSLSASKEDFELLGAEFQTQQILTVECGPDYPQERGTSLSPFFGYTVGDLMNLRPNNLPCGNLQRSLSSTFYPLIQSDLPGIYSVVVIAWNITGGSGSFDSLAQISMTFDNPKKLEMDLVGPSQRPSNQQIQMSAVPPNFDEYHSWMFKFEFGYTRTPILKLVTPLING